MASPTHAIARALGGGGDHGLLIQMTVVSAMSDQNAHFPAGLRGRVQRRYAPIAAVNKAPSTTSVPGIEFHSPRPT
jgi:hypothetical protein